MIVQKHMPKIAKHKLSRKPMRRTYVSNTTKPRSSFRKGMEDDAWVDVAQLGSLISIHCKMRISWEPAVEAALPRLETGSLVRVERLI